MLQTVLGLMRRVSPERSYLTETMGQRLVRAKTKIRDGGIRLKSRKSELPRSTRFSHLRRLRNRLDDMAASTNAGANWPMKDLARESCSCCPARRRSTAF
jgi:predicted RNA polymerase sigma factor